MCLDKKCKVEKYIKFKIKYLVIIVSLNKINVLN